MLVKPTKVVLLCERVTAIKSHMIALYANVGHLGGRTGPL